MDSALLAARLALALVFLVAAFGKLADRPGSRQAMLAFGVPALLAGPSSLLLPLAELVVAAALIPTVTAWAASLGGLALLTLFAGGIGVNLLRGRRPDCHCFGQLYSEPIGAPALIRTGLLAAVAGFVAVSGYHSAGASAVDWLTRLSAAEGAALAVSVAGFGLLLVQWWFLLNVLKQNGRLLERIEALEAGTITEAPAVPAQPTYGLPVGAEAPEFSLSGLYGETMTLAALRSRGKPTALLFTSPHCGPCAALAPEIARWQQERQDLTIALVSQGSVDDNRGKSAEHGLTNLLLQAANETAEAYKSPGTPSAVIVDPAGTIATPLVAGIDAVRELLTQTVAPPQAVPVGGSTVELRGQVPPRPTLQGQAVVGEPAPAIRLRDVHGKLVNLSDFRGSMTMVLFWNTGCGFCSQMLPELREWERAKPKGSPKILVVATGPADDIRAMALRSPVVSDPDSSIARLYGAPGTPMALLVDQRGRVSSPIVAGAPAVMALAAGDVARATAPPPASQNGHVAVKIGEPVPPFSLPDLAGGVVRTADLRGKRTLLLFWNPGCGFCQRMLPNLKDWEAVRPGNAPELLVVSAGPEPDVRAMGLRSRVLLDPSTTLGMSLGAAGTPMAVLVDAEGRVASDVAVGADAVFQLAGSPGTLIQA